MLDQKTEQIFLAALDVADPLERERFVTHACEGDEARRSRVEAFLRANDRAEHVFPTEPKTTAGEEVPTEPFESPGTQIGRYLLLEQIGEGGFGVVYMAEQEEPVRRKVALKIIKAGMDTRQVIARFEAERQALALMNHPNVAKVLDAGATETGRPFFVMELVRGIPITKFCEDKRLAIQERLSLFLPICHAIQHAHQKGIIHRDIKPSNVMVTLNDGVPHPLVIDFGVAKAIDQRLTEKAFYTRFAQMIGTPAYMSPEQAEMSRQDVDTRADVYSLGILLYELLTGTTPFSEERLRTVGFAEFQRIISEEEPLRPSTLVSRMNGQQRTIALNRRLEPASLIRHIKGDLDWIVLKAIDKDRNRRYDTPKELAADLGRFLKGEPILARPIGQAARLLRWCRRKPVVAGLSAALVLAVAAGAAGTLWQLNVAQKNAAESRREISRLNVLNGVDLMEQGDQFRSLLWFAEALNMNADSPERVAINRLRIASIVAQGPRLAAVIAHDGQPVGGAAFHPTKDQLATVGRDRRLRVWNVASGQLIYVTEPFAEMPSDVFYSPDGKRILVTSSEFNHARLLSAAEGKLLAGPVPHYSGGANNRPLHPRFDSTGKRFLTQSAPDTLRVWSTDNAAPLGPAIALDAATAWMNFSPDGETILALTQDGKTTAWDWRTGDQVEVPRSADVPTANLHGVSPRPASGKGTLPETAGEDARATVRIPSPDGTKYATISAGHRVQVWSADTGQPLTPPLDHNIASGPPQFSASGRYLFTMHPAHAVYVWDLKPSGTPPVLLRPAAPHALTESAQDGSVFITRDPNSPIRVRALSGASEVSLHPSSLTRVPVQAWFDETGDYIVLEYPHQQAQIWDAATGLPVTPIFQSRYATNEAGYLTVNLPMRSLVQTLGNNQPVGRSIGGDRGEGARSDSDLRSPSSDLRPLAELLSGSRLDGTGGWKPLELSEIVERWNELRGKNPAFANRLNE